MKPQDSSSLNPNIPRDVILKAVREYWGNNRHFDLSDILNDSRSLTNLRALLPAPYSGYHTDMVRESIHNLSKTGAIPKEVMTGEKTMDEYKAERLDRTTLHRMQDYLEQRESSYSPEFVEFRDSQEWRSAQAELRRKHDFTCQICKADHGGSAEQLHCHHHDYGDATREAFVNLDNLWLLCDDCHSVVHFLRDVRQDSASVAATLFA